MVSTYVDIYVEVEVIHRRGGIPHIYVEVEVIHRRGGIPHIYVEVEVIHRRGGIPHIYVEVIHRRWYPTYICRGRGDTP